MIGEIRDGETADMAVHSALTGHIVLSTLHTNDAAGAIPRMVDMGVEPFLLTSTINVIIGQRLARKICDKCRVEETIPPEEIKKVQDEIGMMPEKEKAACMAKPLKFYKGKGCKACNDTGYKGRVGLYEVLSMSEPIKQLVLAKKQSSDIQVEATKEGMVTMLQDGLIKALTGQTSLEEIWRVTKE
jgi:type II secretory ATPase GspE/PulE/Tfp pilus assembly ATPase PilB-like protein